MPITTTIGAFEAKTKFSELLERVSQGEEITITNHENPVARLVPFENPSQVKLAALFEEMAEFRAAHPLNPKGLKTTSYRDLIEGGRKPTLMAERRNRLDAVGVAQVVALL